MNQQSDVIDIDWQKYLDIHYPHLGSVFLKPQKVTEINAKITARNRKLIETGANYSTTIYDHLVRIIEPSTPNDRQTKVAKGLLHFLDQQISEFNRLTNSDLVLFRQLKDQLEDLFWDNDARYLERIGELLSTIHLIKKFSPARLSSLKHYFMLKNNVIDYKGKDADLCFIHSNQNLTMIDVVSINLQHEKIEDSIGLRKILTDRINQKWVSKKFNDPTLKERYQEIYIQPFLWLYDQNSIERHKDVFENLNLSEALPILTLRQQSNQKGDVFFDCIAL